MSMSDLAVYLLISVVMVLAVLAIYTAMTNPAHTIGFSCIIFMGYVLVTFSEGLSATAGFSLVSSVVILFILTFVLEIVMVNKVVSFFHIDIS